MFSTGSSQLAFRCLERAANAAEIKTEKPNTNQTMILTSKTPLQAKTCALVAASMALATMAASTAAADNLKVFNESVSGVPSANPIAIADNVYSPEFAPGLVVEGIDLLENPSSLITHSRL